jgi:hypothetical protein
MADKKFSQFVAQVDNILPGDQFAGLRSGVNTIFTSQFGEVLTVLAATDSSLLDVSYNNGTAGVGATLTDTTGDFAPLVVDGINIDVGDRVLVFQQALSLQNGIYDLTQNGNGVNLPWILTRTTDFDTVAQIIPGRYVTITDGTELRASIYVVIEPAPATMGVSDINIFSMLEKIIGNQPADTLIGNPTGSVADAIPITLGTNLSFQAGALTGSFLPSSGGTMSGAINMGSHQITSLTDPILPQDAATRNYVDTVATGQFPVGACTVATTEVLLPFTYNNGTAGVGATITFTANGQQTIDDYIVAFNDRILVKNQTAGSAPYNGIYYVADAGSVSSQAIFTRVTDFDTSAEMIKGSYTFITNGTVNANTSWILTDTVTTVGTTAVNFTEFSTSAAYVNVLNDVATNASVYPLWVKATNSGQPVYTSTTKLSFNPNTGVLSLATPLSLSNGGTNASLTASNGGIFYSTASAAAILSGTATANKMLLSGATAAPTWSTSTIPSSAGATANKVLLSDGTNYVLSTPTFPNASATSGKLIISDGTNWIASTSTYPNSVAINTILYASSANAVSTINAANSATLYTNTSGVPALTGSMTNGQLLIGSTSANPVLGTITASTGISVTNGAGSITIASTGVGSLVWNDVSGTTQSAAVNQGYIISNSSQTTVTLPATAAEGSVFAVQGKGTAGWILQMNTGQTCHLGSTATTSAGSLTSTNQWDSVTIVCVTANTTFAVTSVVGNITVA